MVNRKHMLSAVAVVLICLASPSIALAQVTVSVEVTMRDEVNGATKFGERLLGDAKASGHGDATVAEYLSSRIATALNSTGLPMFHFVPAESSTASPRLRLELGTFEGSDSIWPAAAIKMQLSDLPRLVARKNRVLLLDACLNKSCLKKDYATDTWLEDAVDEILSEWEVIGRVLSTYPFKGNVQNDNGMANVDYDPKFLISARPAKALYRVGDPGEFFLACNQKKDPVGPFIDPNSLADAKYVACKNQKESTKSTKWTEFFIERYWP